MYHVTRNSKLRETLFNKLKVCAEFQKKLRIKRTKAIISLRPQSTLPLPSPPPSPSPSLHKQTDSLLPLEIETIAKVKAKKEYISASAWYKQGNVTWSKNGYQVPVLANHDVTEIRINTTKLSISLFSSLSSPTQFLKPNGNSHLADYLVNTFKFTKTQALSISSRFSWVTSPEKPQSVYSFLRELGFSDTHIRSAVRVSPQILFSNIDKTLRPKLDFFQQLGLLGSDLARFISKNSTLLTASLDRKLVPCTEILKKILGNDENAKDLIRVLHRCNWVVTRDPKSRLLGNIAFMESCGIVGSQLSTLLKRQPWLFIVQESVLRSLVAQVVEMGFSLNSGMLVHGLYTVSCLRNGTISKKLDLLCGFGFSKDECMDMFRRTPGLFRTSEEKLKFGIDFFLNTVKFKKSVLIHTPWILMYSMENRVSARYRILEVIKSKRLLKRDPSFYDALILPENEFLDKFISRFRGDAEELLVTYKARLLDSTDEEDS